MDEGTKVFSVGMIIWAILAYFVYTKQLPVFIWVLYLAAYIPIRLFVYEDTGT